MFVNNDPPFTSNTHMSSIYQQHGSAEPLSAASRHGNEVISPIGAASPLSLAEPAFACWGSVLLPDPHLQYIAMS